MIIDQNLVLFESTGPIASGNGNAVALTSLHNPGRAEPIPLHIKVCEDLAGATAVAVKLQQADSETGTYADVPGATESITAANFKKGYSFAWRFLPKNVEKQWVRLVVTVTGTATAGKLFAAVSGFEDLPYTDGMYVDKGIVEG